MASSPVRVEEKPQMPRMGEGNGQFIRVIVADTQAIFRAGLRKIFAVEDDVRVVGQAETLGQAFSAAQKFSADVMLFESALAPNPLDAVSDLLRQNPGLKLVVVTPEPQEEITLELFRRGAHGIVSREIEPEVLVECLRAVSKGEAWLDRRGVQWVLEAYRTHGTRGPNARTKVQLTPKESLIVACVTQGMKNKEIAQRVGTTEQVVKNYLRKVYDKLGVADRLELALYCLNNRVVEAAKSNGQMPAPATEQAVASDQASGEVPSMAAPTPEKIS
jgi:DNA-binding NarL/FixJ family response regulator